MRHHAPFSGVGSDGANGDRQNGEGFMFSKIESSSVFDGVVKQIIESVKSGRLKAGAPLPQIGSMADSMGVSRAEIEDSLHALELLGIVKAAPGNSYYITEDLGSWIIGPLSVLFKLNKGYVRQSQQLRAGLEIEAAILAARKCTPLDAVRLMDILDQMEAAEDEKTREKLDQDLHGQIAQIADNTLIYNIMMAANEITQGIISGTRSYIYSQKQTVEEADRQHHRLVKAIIANDEEEALRSMSEHMRMTEAYLTESQK